MARTRAQDHPDVPKPTYTLNGSMPRGRITTTTEVHKQTAERKDNKREAEDVEGASGEKAKDKQVPASKDRISDIT